MRRRVGCLPGTRSDGIGGAWDLTEALHGALVAPLVETNGKVRISSQGVGGIDGVTESILHLVAQALSVCVDACALVPVEIHYEAAEIRRVSGARATPLTEVTDGVGRGTGTVGIVEGAGHVSHEGAEGGDVVEVLHVGRCPLGGGPRQQGQHEAHVSEVVGVARRMEGPDETTLVDKGTVLGTCPIEWIREF